MLHFGNCKNVTPRPVHFGTDTSIVKMDAKFKILSIYRRAPTPLNWDTLSDEVKEASAGAILDQIPWSLRQCSVVLAASIGKLVSGIRILSARMRL